MGNFLHLYGTRLDDFFDISKDTYVSFTDKETNRKDVQAKLTEGSISVNLMLSAEKENKQFHSIYVHGILPALIDGSKAVISVEILKYLLEFP